MMVGWNKGGRREDTQDRDGIRREAESTVDGVKRTIGLSSRRFNSAVSEIVDLEKNYV